MSEYVCSRCKQEPPARSTACTCGSKILTHKSRVPEYVCAECGHEQDSMMVPCGKCRSPRVVLRQLAEELFGTAAVKEVRDNYAVQARALEQVHATATVPIVTAVQRKGCRDFASPRKPL